jgi:small subunit ribosomal protein S2
MRRFIFGEKNGIYLLDLEKTAKVLSEARDFLRQIAQQGGSVLFVGTKRQAQPIVAEQATRCGQFYVNLRWLGGLLTNFQTLRKSVDKLKTLRTWREDGTLSRFTKKESSQMTAELARLEKSLAGIIEMNRLPKALVIVDTNREDTAVKEAARLGIPVVALVDTNCNPDVLTYAIPANDDAIRSIQLVISLLAEAVSEGYQEYQGAQAKIAEEAAETKAAAEAKAAATALKPELPMDEIEAIVPPVVLRVETEVTPPKKKRMTKVKKEPPVV